MKFLDNPTVMRCIMALTLIGAIAASIDSGDWFWYVIAAFNVLNLALEFTWPRKK